ncbi:MAG: hypothetical protein AAFX40_07215, partial [Cyanobacteria bacterium J06639_1]
MVGAELLARLGSHLAAFYLELGFHTFRYGKQGVKSAVTCLQALERHLTESALWRYAHVLVWSDLASRPLLEVSLSDRERERSKRVQNRRMRTALLSSVFLHGLTAAAWVLILQLVPPPPPEETLIPFELVELPPEELEEP